MSDVDVSFEHDSLLHAFERLGDEAQAILRTVAKDTAEEFRAEVRARLRRQTAGTGRTADAITITQTDTGYIVTSGDQGGRPENLPIWLEYGTKHMTARPSWDAARSLLSGEHQRRVEAAMQRAIDGLGA